MKLSEPADSKTDPGFENRPRFEGVIGQNKIQRTYDHDCTLQWGTEHFEPVDEDEDRVINLVIDRNMTKVEVANMILEAVRNYYKENTEQERFILSNQYV